MFLCRECHKHEEKKGWCTAEHFDWAILSGGMCESCGEVADCVDCKAYKKFVKLPGEPGYEEYKKSLEEK